MIKEWEFRRIIRILSFKEQILEYVRAIIIWFPSKQRFIYYVENLAR